MLNGETRRVSAPWPDTSMQTAWEEADHQVLFAFDETMTELLLRHHLQDWRLRD
jgi:hypothetical protein